MIKLDVTLRKPEELAEQEQEVQRLLGVIKGKEIEIRKMSDFATQNIKYIDMLKEAKQRLDEAGLDSSFIKLR